MELLPLFSFHIRMVADVYFRSVSVWLSGVYFRISARKYPYP